MIGLPGLRALCTEFGALLIFDEVKTGVKIARGGATEYFKVKPDITVLPEQGLFKKAATKPKASVSVTTRPGVDLAGEQVRGIQRLVSAAVTELSPGDVTVLDQHGVALSRSSAADIGPTCEKVASITVLPFQKRTRFLSDVAPVPMSALGQPFWR